MMKCTSLMVALVLMGGVGTSRAGDASVGVEAGVLPGGSVELGYDGASSAASLETAIALAGRIGYDVSSIVRIGGEVLFLPSIRGEGGNDDDPPMRLVSPAARVEADRALSSTASVYGYGRAGYSRLTQPGLDAAGFGVMLGGGLGSRFALSRELDGFVELGYLWSTHEFEEPGPNPRLDLDYYSLSVGVALDL